MAKSQTLCTVGMFIGVLIVDIFICLLALSLSSKRLGRWFVLVVGLLSYTFGSAVGFAFMHILGHRKSIIIIGLSSGMAHTTLVGRIFYVLLIKTDEGIWQPYIAPLMIISGMILGGAMSVVWALSVNPWVGMVFNSLAFFLCNYLLIEMENDVELRIDAEMIEEENGLRKPLLMI